MAKYLVRKGFCVHTGIQSFPEGSEVELTDEEVKRYAHQVEPVKPKSTAKKD